MADESEKKDEAVQRADPGRPGPHRTIVEIGLDFKPTTTYNNLY